MEHDAISSTGPPTREQDARPERPRPERGPDGAEVRKRAVEALEESGHSNREILEKIAEKASEIPPDENLIQLGAAATRLSLISLESARLLAEQVRLEIEIRREEAIRSVASGGRREQAAETLLG